MKSARGSAKLILIILTILSILFVWWLIRVKLPQEVKKSESSSFAAALQKKDGSAFKKYETEAFIFYYPDGSMEGQTKNEVAGKDDYLASYKIKDYGHITLERDDGKLKEFTEESCKSMVDSSLFDVKKDKVFFTKVLNSDNYNGCEVKYQIGIAGELLNNGEVFDERIHHDKWLQLKNTKDNKFYIVRAMYFTARAKEHNDQAYLDALDQAVEQFTLK